MRRERGPDRPPDVEPQAPRPRLIAGEPIRIGHPRKEMLVTNPARRDEDRRQALGAEVVRERRDGLAPIRTVAIHGEDVRGHLDGEGLATPGRLPKRSPSEPTIVAVEEQRSAPRLRNGAGEPLHHLGLVELRPLGGDHDRPVSSS